ncbi:MAG: hypothetical protein JJU25_14825 [Halomonas sp.]|nr:hypothetical protein [Halomonas sp.]MCC5883893.1 hypothetical protein [Halomonas sp.]
MSQYEPLHHHSQPTDTKDSTPPPQPDFYMPAMPPLGLINAIETLLHRYLRRRRFRQRYLPLLAHDDHMLEDMNHRRDDIRWASSLPLKEDAEQALAQRREKYKVERGRNC